MSSYARISSAAPTFAPPSRAASLLDRTAAALAIVASPPVAAILAFLWVGGKGPGENALTWAAVLAGVAVLGPMLFLVFARMIGAVADLEISRREQRRGPYLVALSGALSAWILVSLFSPHQTLAAVAASLFLLEAVLVVVNAWWKISVHAAGAAFLGATAWILGAPPAAPLLLVGLVAWSRVRLGRHTFAQTVAGAAAASSAVVLVLMAVRGVTP